MGVRLKAPHHPTLNSSAPQVITTAGGSPWQNLGPHDRSDPGRWAPQGLLFYRRNDALRLSNGQVNELSPGGTRWPGKGSTSW